MEDISISDYKSNQQQGARQYKDLITIHCGKSEGSMKDRLKVDHGGKVRRISLSEKTVKNACESHGADLIRYLYRTYLKIVSIFTVRQ